MIAENEISAFDLGVHTDTVVADLLEIRHRIKTLDRQPRGPRVADDIEFVRRRLDHILSALSPLGIHAKDYIEADSEA
jgi:hypothetical protein